jgi:hypothetical protein
MKLLNFIILALPVMFSFLISNASGWTWKDLRVGVTTEEELIKFGGVPAEVIFINAEDYFLLKLGKPYSVRFVYYDTVYHRGMVGIVGEDKILYNPYRTPIITTAPLKKSEEMNEVKMVADLWRGRLNFYAYTFRFNSAINRTKYIETFNWILGNPVSISEGLISKNSIWIDYEHYHVSIDFDRNEIMLTDTRR